MCRVLLGSWVCGDGGKEDGAWNSIVVDEGFSRHTIWLWIPGGSWPEAPYSRIAAELNARG